MTSEYDNWITIALTKGRLAQLSIELIESAGIDCSDLKKKSRKLVFVNKAQKIRFFLAKAADVPTYVEHGAADIGICGKDILLEDKRNVYEVLDLKIGKCKMVVAGSKDLRLYDSHNLRVATKYPVITKNFFYNKRNTQVEIIKLNGSVELGPIVSLSDAIVDIVETGETLRANGLIVLDEITDISARLVVNRVSMKMKYERVAGIIDSLRNLTENGEVENND